MTVADEAMASAAPDVGPCPCGVAGPAPWRGHDIPWSPASVVAGVLTLAFAVLAAVAGRVPWVAPPLAAAYVASTGVAFVVLGRDGHRGGCRVRRALWIGLAAFGLPLRIVAAIPF
ncbi:hypothetical protein KSP35_08480 [Aquihabitans sp. G128]|uniref:hypothetical protein n=1 Tax=Aquihabitans sp. G128 TaxID=2849779 RepID=UPI001C235BAA|nr:hypothetical protein [Aquihabitans sp. G128]QXC62800.1 hypothetical protein KSP35_08480 [Aquihabitans sp. G128]